ncbi:MAG TPA: universal stress protein [Chthoniobacterales bacterium]|nr:universal stress protein [Chthoniobacterales bacterium]
MSTNILEPPMPAGSARSTNSSTQSFPKDRLRIRTILVPLDFSRRSQKAIDYALSLVDRFSAKLHFVHVFDHHSSPPALARVALAMPEDEMGRRAKLRLQDIAGKYAADIPPENLHAIKGNDSHEICELAGELEADLIVATTHGHTGLKHLFLGSTAERLVQHAPCPILVVRERERDFLRANGQATSQASIQLKKILVPVDFFESSRAGLEYALRFAQVWGAELVLLNCVPLPLPVYGEYGGRALPLMDDYAQDSAKEEMQELVGELQSRGFSVAGATKVGAPAETICDYAQDHDVDLIIASTQGSTGLKHAFVGRTAEHVVRCAPCPVLVAPSHSARTLSK